MTKVLFPLLLSVAIVTVSTDLLAQDSSGIEQVRAANDSYYSALSDLNIDAMSKVWARSSDDTNIAPPVHPVANRGWGAVRRNYEQFWSTLRELKVSMEQPMITVRGPVAWVYGVETAHRKMKNGEEQTGSNMGTSIFVKEDGRWLMVFHQAAAIPRPK